jgi:predicted metalloprotease with PDZ domain
LTISFRNTFAGAPTFDYNSIVSGIGLQLNTKDAEPGTAYLGADLNDDGNKLTVRSVAVGTPAYDQGLNTGDQIVAIDGFRANLSFLKSYVGERKPGDKIRLTLFRFDKLRDMTIALGAADWKDYSFAPVSAPTEEQKRLYHGYLNADL